MQLPRKMSAQNVMANISRTLGSRESKPTVANEIRFAGDERKDKLYEPKHKQKMVRVLTVIAYVIFVSMAAILLSLYYTFLWDPQNQSVRMMRLNKECTNIKLSDSLIIPPILNETQLENVATRSAARDNDEELSNIITPQQKGLLTLSLESTDMQKNASSATTEITHSTLSAESNASPEITQENIS